MFYRLTSSSHWSGILLEVQVLECEVCLHDAGGLHSGPQHVLLRGDVLALGYPLQVVQVAGGIGSTGVRALGSTSAAPKQRFVDWSRAANHKLERVNDRFVTVQGHSHDGARR